MVERLASRRGGSLAGPALDRQGALSHSGAHHFGREYFGYAGGQSQTRQAGSRQNDRIILAIVEFTETRVHIASHRIDLQIRAQLLKLRRTSQRASSDLGAFAKLR